MRGSAPFVSSALDPDVHQSSRFDCGDAELTSWLKESAANAGRARVARTFVWTRSDDDEVLGYYALSAHAVLRAEAPSRVGRGVPDPIPAALIGKLALDVSLQRRGLGDLLLADALARIIAASRNGPAVRAIVVDASTERGRQLYERFGFVPAPGSANRMIVRAETVARAVDQA